MGRSAVVHNDGNLADFRDCAGPQRLGLGAAFLAAMLSLTACDESKSGGETSASSPTAATKTKMDSDKVFTVKTREDLRVAEELSQYFHRKAELVRAGHAISDVLDTIVASDKNAHGITGSGLAEHYGKVLGEKMGEFKAAYASMLASEHYKTCRDNKDFQANFAPIAKYVDVVERTIADIRAGFAPSALAATWEPRDSSDAEHSTMGIRTKKLAETIAQFGQISDANIVKWAGKDGVRPGVVLAMAPDVVKEANGKGWFSASALSMTPSLMNIGGVGFSIVSINPDAFALASPNFSLFSVATPGLEEVGGWLAPVALEEAAELGLAELATDAAIGVAGAGAVEGAAEALGAASIFEELLEGLLFFL